MICASFMHKFIHYYFSHLMFIVVIANAAMADFALGAVDAVSLVIRLTTVKIVLAVLREGEGAGVVEAAATSGSACSVDAAHVVQHHVDINPAPKIGFSTH